MGFGNQTLFTNGTITWAQFHQRSRYGFNVHRSQKRKKDTDDLTEFLRFGELWT